MHGGTEVNGAVQESVSAVVVTPVAVKPVGALSTLPQLSVDDTDEDERDDGATEEEVACTDEDVVGTEDEVVATDDDLLDGATELNGATEDGADDEPVPPLRLPYTSNSHSEYP